MDTLEFLDRLHAALRPRAYLEIGGGFGESLRLSRTSSIAVAPSLPPALAPHPGQPWLKVYQETSDDFFRSRAAEATLEGRSLDLALIDGVRDFDQAVRDLEHVARWGHVDTVVVVRGEETGDLGRVVQFLEEHRPDLASWLVDVGATGALVVTGLDPGHAAMAEMVEACDCGCSPSSQDQHHLPEPVPPQTVLRALRPRPQPDGYEVQEDGWVHGPDGWVAAAGETAGYLCIVLHEPIRGSHRASLALTASGMPVLRLQLRYATPEGSPASDRYRFVYLDVTHPGALLHGLDSLWLDADAVRCAFELDWESTLEPGEALTGIAIEPLDYWLRPIPATPEMTIDVQRFKPRQIGWPRPGIRFAPERFPGRSLPPKRKAGKRDAVVFAWWLPASPEAHKLGEYYLGLLRYHHADSRIFVGINHGSDPGWIGQLKDSGLDVEIASADPAVQVPSDAGGFLAALGAFARAGEEFDLVWFGHTKGASRPEFDEYNRFRHQHDRRFWSRRTDVDRLFADPKIGLYSHRYALHDPSPHVPWRGFGDLDSLERVYRDTHAPLGLWAWETVFVMRHEIVRRFCAAVGEEFFRLDPTSYGAGPWWFEAAFPSIASMQGFEPAIELDTDGEGSPRDDVVLYDDPQQTNRLAMEELQRWRDDPFTFAPRALPRDYLRNPYVGSDATG